MKSGHQEKDAAAVAAVLYREARLLDEDRLEEWLALFAPDARYRVPLRAGADPERDPAIVHDDRAALEDRVRRLRSPVSYAQQPPSRTVHVVTNVEVEAEAANGAAADAPMWRAHSALVVHEARLGQARAFAARCLHRLRAGAGPDGGLGIVEKRVLLIARDQALYNVTFLL